MIRVNSTKAMSQITAAQMQAKAAAARAADLSPVFRAIAVDLAREIEASFETESSPSGTRWPALKPSTIAKRRGRGNGILDLTSRLRRSFRFVARPQSLTLYNTSGYFDPHQRGDRRRRPPRPPQRQMVPFTSLGGGSYRFMGTGRGAEFAARFKARVRAYVVTGRV